MIGLRAEPTVLFGSLRHGDNLEVSVLFSDPVDLSTLLSRDSYNVAPGRLDSVGLIATNRGALLRISGASPNFDVNVDVFGVENPDHTAIAATNSTLSASPPQWLAIGANELALRAYAYAVGPDGFDLFSGGYQQTGDYDEATFVAETISGDFDRRVRVEYVQPSSAAPRIGLMVRETLDTGRPRPLDPSNPAEAFSRYVELAILPAQTASGAVGENTHAIYQRSYTGGIGRPGGSITQRLAIDPQLNDNPEFPDAWLRLRRIGDSFEFYRGTNGLDWVSLGTATFPQPLPETLFVGPSFSPQNGALSQDLRRSYFAAFREYGGPDRDPLELKIKQLPAFEAEVSWTGSGLLQEADEVTGEWRTASSQANPQVIDLQRPRRFFRLLSTEPSFDSAAPIW